MHLTVIPSDQAIYLETIECQHPNRRCHVVNNDSEFWNSVDPRIIAIQYHSDGLKQIEYKNPREDVPITDVSTLQKYIDRFNLTEQTYQAQVSWDKNNVQITLENGTKRAETSEEKITRLGPRP
jgi:ABC-type uncharacterized transport system ATPase subunit